MLPSRVREDHSTTGSFRRSLSSEYPPDGERLGATSTGAPARCRLPTAVRYIRFSGDVPVGSLPAFFSLTYSVTWTCFLAARALSGGTGSRALRFSHALAVSRHVRSGFRGPRTHRAGPGQSRDRGTTLHAWEYRAVGRHDVALCKEPLCAGHVTPRVAHDRILVDHDGILPRSDAEHRRDQDPRHSQRHAQRTVRVTIDVTLR
jgi:hypothetical protein